MLDLALPLMALLLGHQKRQAGAAPAPAPTTTTRPRPRPRPRPTEPRPRPGRRPPTVSPAPPRPAPTPVTAPLPHIPAPVAPPPAWPSAVPSDLPPFPSGWRPHPKPGAVAGRASVLLPQLWARGAGSHVIEQTSGEWVAYRAEMMGSKKGVVAYVPKEARATPRPAARPAPTPRLPAPAPPPPPETVLTSSPGVVPSLFPASERAMSRPVLTLGSKGPDVVWVQNRLGVTPATGNFGSMTAGRVKAFQSQNGLKSDGVVGPATWAALGA